MESTANRWCDKLGVAAPCVEDAMQCKDVKLFHLMVMALLEHGEPLDLDDIALRLDLAGVEVPTGDLALSLKKSWHGREPVYRLPDGRLGLVLDSSELEHILWLTELRAPRPLPPLQPAVPEPEQPGDETPLRPQEVSEVLQADGLRRLSQLRTAAAVLDAHAKPLALAEVDRFLTEAVGEPRRIYVEDPRYWAGRLVALDENGRLHVQRDAPQMRIVRRTVRDALRIVRRERALREEREAFWAAREAERAEVERQAAGVSALLRRAVLRTVPDPAEPRALALLDEATRSIRTFVGGELAAVPDALGGFDLLAGLHVRDTLHALRLEPERWRLVDLKPPQKTRRLNRWGRMLQITPELLIAGTTGISRPLGEPAKVAAYLAAGEASTRLRRRLESDVKALHAFYRYGVLHHCVRLRWGFLDELLGVDWAQPGEPTVREALRLAAASSAPVDLVVGSAPGWQNPWSRARRVRVLEVGTWDATCQLDGAPWMVDLRDVQSVRLVDGV